MASSLDIYSKVSDYVNNRVTIRELEEWNASRLPFYMSNPDNDLSRIASLIELSLSELDSEITSERIIKRKLRRLLPSNLTFITPYLEDDSEQVTISSYDSLETTDFVWQDQLPTWSTVPQVEYE